MNADELREQTEEQLEQLLKDKRAKLTQLRFDVSARQHKNHQEIKETKKEIARILTIMGAGKKQDQKAKK